MVWLAALAAVAPAAANPDAETLALGEKLFEKNCARCHQVGEGAKNKVGPHLDQLPGRTAGSVEAFRYSSALKKAGEEGLVWSAETLSQFLEKPRDFVKGNRMSFRGLDKSEERDAVITWLVNQGDAAPTDNLEEKASTGDSAAPGFTEEIMKIAADRDFGEYLAGDCVTCHQISGRSEGIPSIVGLPKEYFIRALVEYKTNVRTNEVMKVRVQSLTNEDIAHLAEYFAGLEPQ